MNKEQFKKKLKYGKRYCLKHDYIMDKALRHRVTNVMIVPAHCPECYNERMNEQLYKDFTEMTTEKLRNDRKHTIA